MKLKQLAWALAVLVVVTYLTVGQQPYSPNNRDIKALVLDIGVAQSIWDAGLAETPNGLSLLVKESLKEALSVALILPRSPQEAIDANYKRCEKRDPCGAGASHECLRKFVVLELTKPIMDEWLNLLKQTGEQSQLKLSEKAAIQVDFAFCRAKFGRQSRCYLGE